MHTARRTNVACTPNIEDTLLTLLTALRGTCGAAAVHTVIYGSEETEKGLLTLCEFCAIIIIDYSIITSYLHFPRNAPLKIFTT